MEGTRIVLEAMADAGVGNIVFSSSAAVYGTPDVPLVTEDLPKRPASPYGESKLIGEWLLRDQGVATADSAVPLRHTSLRYFNVVGSGYPDVYDTSPHNLFPLVFEALLEQRTPKIFGDDYATPDGTNVRELRPCVRHRRGACRRRETPRLGAPVEPAYNLGSQNGLSVREIMDAMARVTGIDFTPEISPRRPGDPDRIVATANSRRATSAGRTATRSMRWSAAAGTRAATRPEPGTGSGGGRRRAAPHDEIGRYENTLGRGSRLDLGDERLDGPHADAVEVLVHGRERRGEVRRFAHVVRSRRRNAARARRSPVRGTRGAQPRAISSFAAKTAVASGRSARAMPAA